MLTAEMYSLKRNKHTEIGHKIQSKFKIHQENKVQKVNFADLTVIKQMM